MQLIGNLIVRLVVIVVGFMLAAAAAGLFIGLGFYNELLATQPPLHEEEVVLFRWLSAAVGIASGGAIGVAAFAIAAILIAVAELMRWRGFIANLLLGGVCGLYLGIGAGPPGGGISEGTLLVATAAGFIGGGVYWLIAGHGAGSWLPARPNGH